MDEMAQGKAQRTFVQVCFNGIDKLMINDYDMGIKGMISQMEEIIIFEGLVATQTHPPEKWMANLEA